MPKSAPRPCRVQGCAGLTSDGPYCEKHSSEPTRTPDERPSAAARGYGHEWRKWRRMVLSREPLCRECRKNGRLTIATDVDHIIPRSEGGTNEISNLQALCHSCHSRKTAVQSSGWSKGEGE